MWSAAALCFFRPGSQCFLTACLDRLDAEGYELTANLAPASTPARSAGDAHFTVHSAGVGRCIRDRCALTNSPNGVAQTAAAAASQFLGSGAGEQLSWALLAGGLLGGCRQEVAGTVAFRRLGCPTHRQGSRRRRGQRGAAGGGAERLPCCRMVAVALAAFRVSLDVAASQSLLRLAVRLSGPGANAGSSFQTPVH